MKMVELSYKPYYHSAVKRWYPSKGDERHIIASGLEPLAKRIAKELEMRKFLEESKRREMLEEAVRLRAESYHRGRLWQGQVYLKLLSTEDLIR